jgi:hypothetical protein
MHDRVIVKNIDFVGNISNVYIYIYIYIYIDTHTTVNAFLSQMF